MRKSQKIGLKLNKKVVSNFKLGNVLGGSGAPPGQPDPCKRSLVGQCGSQLTCYC